MKVNTRKSSKGFTLIELLIVLAILGLLAALIGPSLFGSLEKGKRTTAASQMSSFESALANYRIDVGRYPESLEGLVENDSGRESWSGPYMKKIPDDPWGNAYHYELDGQQIELLSYGADGVPGGQDDDADIEL